MLQTNNEFSGIQIALLHQTITRQVKRKIENVGLL